MINNIINNNINITDRVKQSSIFINSNKNKKVTINYSILKDKLSTISILKYPKWSDCHKININIITLEHLISIILCIDSVNFCFWPYEQVSNTEFEYDNLVEGFTKQSPDFFNSDVLINLKVEDLISKFHVFPEEFPLISERCRSLNELGLFIKNILNDNVNNLLSLCDYDCEVLCNYLISCISTFRDESVYKGRQVFLYKRAQICAADMYSALKEKNIHMKNSEKLTMFPDYRVPQILNQMGIIEYSLELNEKIKKKTEISSNSEEEIEIRLMTVYVVEEIKSMLKKEFQIDLTSYEIDYILWNEGEKYRKEIVNHHRTLTIFY